MYIHIYIQAVILGILEVQILMIGIMVIVLGALQRWLRRTLGPKHGPWDPVDVSRFAVVAGSAAGRQLHRQTR